MGANGTGTVRAGDLVFVAGLMSVDGDGSVLAPGDVRAQARNVLERLAAALREAGGSVEDVVELTTFHDDVRQIDAVFEVGRDYLGPRFPAWTPVPMNGAPVRGALVVARAIAHVGAGEKTCLVPDTIKWWRRHPVSAGCLKDDIVCVAGQYGTDADGNVNTPGDHGGQTRNALNRMKEICELAGGSLRDVVDIWSFHQDPRGIDACADVYEREFFADVEPDESPAWTAAGTPALYRLGMFVQFRALAELGGGGRTGHNPDPARHVSTAARKRAGRLVAITGELADPRERLAPGDPEAQARSAFERIAEDLGRAGGSPADVVEITCFHKDPRHSQLVMDVALDVLDRERPPAWTAVGMTGFRLEEHLHSIHALAVL